MKIDGAITILIDRNGTTIKLKDNAANTTFATVTLAPEQLSAALSRLACVPCHIEARGLDRVGKRHEHKKFEFPLPEEASRHETRAEKACEVADSLCPEGWLADNYFGSQDSFFKRDGRPWARTTIRRWVELKEDGNDARK